MDEVNDTKVMEDALARMTPKQRDHLRCLIMEVVQCYLQDNLHALVLVGDNDSPLFKIISVNTTDINASSLLAAADQYVNFKVMEEAPPKEMFN